MRIVRHTPTELYARRLPWVRWSGALLTLLVGAIFAFEAWLSPSLVCENASCAFREPLRAARTFAASSLTAAEAEAHHQRPRLARFVLDVGAERVLFDQRFYTLTEVNALIEQVDEYRRNEQKHGSATLIIGRKPDLKSALPLFAIVLFGAAVLAMGGRVFGVRFNAATGELSIVTGGIFAFKTRRTPIADVRSVSVEPKQDGRMTTYFLVLTLANGERIAVCEYLLKEQADKAELRSAIAAFVPGGRA